MSSTTTDKNRWLKATIAVGASLGLSLSLGVTAVAQPSGEAEEPLEEAVEQDDQAHDSQGEEGIVPVVTDTQLERILNAVASAEKNAVKAKDPKKLGNRIAGEAGRIHELNLRNQKIDPDSIKSLPGVSAQSVRAVWMDTDDSFPRTITVVTQEKDDAVPLLLMLRQQSARENYQLINMLPMLKESKLPADDLQTSGTQVITPDDGQGLVMTPEKAVAKVTSALDDAGSDDNKSFADSEKKVSIHKTQKDLKKAMDEAEVEVDFTRRIYDDSLQAVRLPDGSAIVFAAISSSETFTPGTNTTLNFGKLATKIADEQDVSLSGTSPVKLRYREHLALHIPAEGKVTLIGHFSQLADVN